MARTGNIFACQACGAVHPKWTGQCDSCGAWNTIVEEARSADRATAAGRALEIADLTGTDQPPPRFVTQIDEVDRVFGGGLVAGSASLISGDPGVGKSTLLLHVVAALSRLGRRCVYISGEESADQIRLRAKRMAVADAAVGLAAAGSVDEIVAGLDTADGPEVLVIDSIQTMYVDTLDSAPGTVAQVRASAAALIRLAKRRGMAVLLVGHVTKDGQIAGPRVLEHMVDAVLYFEGDTSHQFRILRAVKNRFGATDEIGVLRMTDRGLEQVANPSALFLAERAAPVSGAAVFAAIEGSRSMLVEIEALVSPSPLGTPRRAVVGWDNARLAMILAVLDARCELALGAKDVYLNVAGGLKITEPAADLAVAAALVSSLTDQPVPERTVIFGEIGLSGEIRPVSQADARLKEAARLGYDRAFAPPMRGTGDDSVSMTEIARLADLVGLFSGGSPRVAATG